MREKIRGISGQFGRYFVVAGIGYVFDFGTLIILHELLNVHYLASAAVGFVVGLIVLYVLSGKYVFKGSKIKSRSLEFGVFALIGIVGLGILSLSMWMLTGLLDLNYLLSKIIATAGVYIWNFFARRSLYNN
jgi:putative flippase GtrA